MSTPSSTDEPDQALQNAKRTLLKQLYDSDLCESIEKRPDGRGFNVTVADGHTNTLLARLPGWVQTTTPDPATPTELELTIDTRLYKNAHQ